jgi:hypothetical protein
MPQTLTLEPWYSRQNQAWCNTHARYTDLTQHHFRTQPSQSNGIS